MKYKKTIILIGVIILIIIAITYLEHGKTRGVHSAPVIEISTETQPHTNDYEVKAKKYKKAIELASPSGFINTEPFKIADLVGKKVILLDFWTYSCINCQRTLPYLTDLYNKYKDQGFVIIGIHAPEFEFEKNRENVVAATKKFGIEYPVVQDNDLGTWDAYKNRYWPAHYIIDINGLIVEQHIGEGGYAETETKIQELLKERASVLGEEFVKKDMTAISVPVINAQSPETYFGWSRNEYLGNGKAYARGTQEFLLPEKIKSNTLYLSGTWDFNSEYASNVSTAASIIYKYKAANVYFVAHSQGGAVIEIYRDGVKLEGGQVTDRENGGIVNIKDAQLYTLIHEQSASEHTLEIKIKKGTIEAFTFTFG